MNHRLVRTRWLEVREQGKHMTDARISVHMMHVGNYRDGAGAGDEVLYRCARIQRDLARWCIGNQLSWLNLKVPGGEDFIEFMLAKETPPPDKRGTAHHLCLEVPNVAAAVAVLEAKPYRKQYTHTIEPKTGVNRKRQANLFDPDGTRSEIMEPVTIDGKPTPSSTAPPPR